MDILGSNNSLLIEDGSRLSVMSGQSTVAGTSNSVVVTGSGSTWNAGNYLAFDGAGRHTCQ